MARGQYGFCYVVELRYYSFRYYFMSYLRLVILIMCCSTVVFSEPSRCIFSPFALWYFVKKDSFGFFWCRVGLETTSQSFNIGLASKNNYYVTLLAIHLTLTVPSLYPGL